MFFFLILPSLSPSSLKFSHSSIQHLPIPLALLMESRHPRRRSLASLPDGVLLMVAMHVASSPKPFADIGNLKLSTFRQVTSDRMVERCIAVDREYDRMTWGGLERKERYIAFVRRCSDAGNSEANCILGVQLLSTHGERYAGISRLLGAKESGHEAAAYILGMLYFQEVDTRVVGVELLNMLATGCSSCNCIRGTEPGCLILHCRRKTTSLSWCKTFWKLPNDMSLSSCANAACGRVIGSAWMPDDELRRTFCSPLCSGQFFQEIRSQLENDFMKYLEAETNNEHEVEAIRPLPWYPDKLAWHLNFSRMQLRKNQTLERFHEFLKLENEVGNITRQEAVSMVPPLFLDVLPDHHILDMCAAPGSKTFQLLEIIHLSTKPGSLPNGLVIANDADVQRCNLLIHQTKRMSTANLVVTNHEAQHFPGCSLTKDRLEGSKNKSANTEEEKIEPRKSILQFDRILCDVPCSGDGTLRKAPDIWRKWNAGMGNGVHRLQVEIVMRGLALLKVGGRMVYSTCSMNPVENEAVVAEILRRSAGSVELLDVSGELPELVRRPGLKSWKVRDKGLWLSSYEDVPKYRRSLIIPSMFPSGQSFKKNHIISDDLQEDTQIDTSELRDQKTTREQENVVKLDNNVSMDGNIRAPCEMEDGSSKCLSLVEISAFPLDRCMRIVPHDQNTGAFFIAVFQKLSSFHDAQENHSSRLTNPIHKVATNQINLEGEKSEIKISKDDPCRKHNIIAEAGADGDSLDKTTEDSIDSNSKDNVRGESGSYIAGESGHEVKTGTKGKLQTQGKWRGVDPVVFFRDEVTVDSIKSFYGISQSFPLDGHLVTRNTDADHVKRIYYISKSVHDILQLNFQVGQRLKITSVGLKIFERQSAKDGSSPCVFRLSSEGLPLLLPYISKQILFAALADFQHLLQYRNIKFADFVDADFGKKASELMSGCCVVVLNEGNQTTDTIQVDPSSIAIVCWKGRNSLSIMVSEQDGQELLERLLARFGSLKTEKTSEAENNSIGSAGKDSEAFEEAPAATL